MLRLTSILSGFVLLLAPTAVVAAPSWSLLSFTAKPGDVHAVVKAADKLMRSEIGQTFPGKLLLQQSIANGADPATHNFVPIYASPAEREAFVTALMQDPAYAKFLKTMSKKTVPASQTLYRTLGSWGETTDTDHVWMAHAFQVSDPEAFVSAINRFMRSTTGKKFPGQVYLSAVVAGGDGGATHLISVGYASEVEMHEWFEVRDATNDWRRYLSASRGASEYLGGTLSRDLKAWGPATFQEITRD